MTNPFAFAAKSKGLLAALKRLITILNRYGFTVEKIDRALMQFVELLKDYDVNPTFPITGKVLMRHPTVAQRLHQAQVELAAHGWLHVSFAKMPIAKQKDAVAQTQAAFASANIPVVGFRSPYLSHNTTLPTVLQDANFSYVSNQSILWPVVGADGHPADNWASYQRAQDFYKPWSPEERVTTPRLIDTSLIEIPVSLPDDEMLVDRLGTDDSAVIENAWCTILDRIYQQEGLFTLQLHPERISQCANALAAVLQTARGLNPSVWIARLDEVAEWWYARTTAEVTITPCEYNNWEFQVNGPPDTVWLMRGVTAQNSSQLWANDYRLITTPSLKVQSETRPFIGVIPEAPSLMLSFLQQQGYLVEKSSTPSDYSIYLEQNYFESNQEQSLLAKIEGSGQPLVKLGCWPKGARCAMAVTGDIDALTVWDYLWRLLGQ